MPQSQKTLEFLQKLKDKGHWNDDYDYSLVDYKSQKDRVRIRNISSNTIHLVRPLVLIKGYGCVMENAISKNKYAIYLYRKIHGNKYNYPSLNYENAKSIINVECKKHGVFKISHNKHAGGRQCPKCNNEKRGQKRKLKIVNQK